MPADRPALTPLPVWLGPLLGFLAIWVALAWLAPPAAVPAHAPPEVFSGERAVQALTRVLGDGAPHPVGSAANRAVEARIQAELAAIGLSARVEEDAICAEHCARVRNLLVELPGRTARPPILVSTHYDSVHSGPGAGDAGAAVGAMLELARLLHHQPLDRPVWLLFNEGEEAGLLGAQTFARRGHPVAAVINLEARGTGGNAFLFELKGAALPWARRYAAHASSPSLSSLYTAIYDLLPNNTDATIYGLEGLPVANVAFLGGGVRYHTPRDDLAHLDPDSVQHLGEQALGLLRALQDADLSDLEEEAPGVFWDTGFFVLAFDVTVFRVLVLGLFVAAVVMAARRRRGARALGVAVLLPLGAALVAALASFGLGLLGAELLGVPAIPWLGLVLLGFAFVQLGARWTEDAWEGLALLFAGLALLLALVLPQGSYLFAQPALALLIASLLPWAPGRILLGWLGSLPLLHLAAGLVHALGLFAPLLAGSMTLALLPQLPAWRSPEPRVLAGSFLTAGALLVATLGLPAATESHPTGWIATHLTDGGRATLQITPARFPYPPATEPAGEPATTELRQGRYVRRASPASLPTVRLVPVTEGRVRVEAPPEVIGLYLRGPVRMGSASANPFHFVGNPDGLELELTAPIWGGTIHPGLPETVEVPEGVVPIHRGFQTWIGERYDLP